MSSSSGPEVVEKLSVAGALPAAPLLAQFDAGQVASPETREELLARWRRSNEAYSRSVGPGRSLVQPDDVREISGVDPRRVEDLTARLRAYPPFDAHEVQVKLVRISKMVTPQIMVNVPRLERRGHFQRGMTNEELFRLAFEPGQYPEPVYRQTLGLAPNGGAILYTSRDEDIRLHHPPQIRKLRINEKDPRGPELEAICFPVGGGLPFAQGLRIQLGPGLSRLILANGIHRAVAAYKAGLEWFPLALVDLNPIEVPDQFVDLPKGFLLDLNSNPPLVTDFCDDFLAIQLSLYRQLRTVRFNWNFETLSLGLR